MTLINPEPGTSLAESCAALGRFVRLHRNIVVLSGAGCSTGSGIPDYRDARGEWKHRKPMTFQSFVSSERRRQRYWAGSLLGYERIARAQPNPAHLALAELEARGAVRCVVTQNVDGLHQRAGSREVVDLHGRLDRVVCLQCGLSWARELFQRLLLARNEAFVRAYAAGGVAAPDGDTRLMPDDHEGFEVPGCPRCCGLVKPEVVFFGESVPRTVVARAAAHLDQADALLVVGSSLMVFSGYRFVKAAASRGLPIAILNLGLTRGDDLATLRVWQDCATVLGRVVAAQPDDGLGSAH